MQAEPSRAMPGAGGLWSKYKDYGQSLIKPYFLMLNFRKISLYLKLRVEQTDNQ